MRPEPGQCPVWTYRRIVKLSALSAVINCDHKTTREPARHTRKPFVDFEVDLDDLSRSELRCIVCAKFRQSRRRQWAFGPGPTIIRIYADIKLRQSMLSLHDAMNRKRV